MSPIELAVVIIGFGIEIAISVVGLWYISREVRYVANIQRAILLRTDSHGQGRRRYQDDASEMSCPG
jgi:hypothetical protein